MKNAHTKFHNIDFKKGSNMALIAVFFSVLFTIFATFVCEVYFINHSKVNAQIMNDVTSDAVATKMLVVNEEFQKKHEGEDLSGLSEAQIEALNKKRDKELKKKMTEEAGKTINKVIELNQSKTQYAYNYQASLNTKKLTKKSQAKVDLSTQTRSTFMNTQKSGFDFTRPGAPNSDTYTIKTTATTEFGNWAQAAISWAIASIPYATYSNGPAYGYSTPRIGYTSTGLVSSTDCSGLMWMMYHHVGCKAPVWSTSYMSIFFYEIPKSQMQPGDVFLWVNPDGGFGHTMMFIGNGKLIEMGGVSGGIGIANVATYPGIGKYKAMRIKPQYAPTGMATATPKIKTYKLDDKQKLKVVCAIVCGEGGGSYKSALAVASCMFNRCDSKKYASSDVYEIATAPSQFTAYNGNQPYRDYMAHPEKYPHVLEAVSDAASGVRNHKYLSFRTSSASAKAKWPWGKEIGGNWFF